MGRVVERRASGGLALSPVVTWAGVAWGLVFGLALALSVVVAADGEPLPGDLRVTRWAQDLPAFHTVARAFRWGMGTEGVLLGGAVVALGLWLAKWRHEAAALVVALIALRIMQPVIKSMVGRERPAEDLVERRAGFSSESFPSGHMMSAFVLCGMLAVVAWRLPLPRGVKVGVTAVLAVVVALNGTSSVYMGVHWPSDVLGGVLWGLVIVIPAGLALIPRPPLSTSRERGSSGEDAHG